MAEHAGYYRAQLGDFSQAIVNVFYMLGNIVAPAVLCFLSAKWTMVVGSVFFTLSFVSYLIMNEIVIYVSSAFLGLMFAVFNTGYSRYITQISTVATIEKVNGLEWSIACFSTLIGGILYIPLTMLDPNSMKPTVYREYSDMQINREVENSISSIAESKEQAAGGKVKEMGSSIRLTISSFLDPLILQLSPHFIYVGFQNSVWLSVYPTAMQLTESLSSYIFATAYYGMMFSLGSITMGTLMGPLSRRVNHFGQTPCLCLAIGLQTLCALLILLSVPSQSTTTPNNDASLLIPPNLPTCLLLGFLFGLLDSCNNTNRTVMCVTAAPSKRPQAFAIARFYQALAGSALLFCSPLMSTYTLVAVEAINCALGAFFFLRVVRRLNDPHKRAPSVSTTVVASPEGRPGDIPEFPMAQKRDENGNVAEARL